MQWIRRHLEDKRKRDKTRAKLGLKVQKNTTRADNNFIRATSFCNRNLPAPNITTKL